MNEAPERRPGTDRAILVLDFTLLFPALQPPFAGKTSFLAESLVHSSAWTPTLALGRGNSPSGGPA